MEAVISTQIFFKDYVFPVRPLQSLDEGSSEPNYGIVTRDFFHPRAETFEDLCFAVLEAFESVKPNDRITKADLWGNLKVSVSYRASGADIVDEEWYRDLFVAVDVDGDLAFTQVDYFNELNQIDVDEVREVGKLFVPELRESALLCRGKTKIALRFAQLLDAEDIFAGCVEFLVQTAQKIKIDSSKAHF